MDFRQRLLKHLAGSVCRILVDISEELESEAPNINEVLRGIDAAYDAAKVVEMLVDK